MPQYIIQLKQALLEYSLKLTEELKQKQTPRVESVASVTAQQTETRETEDIEVADVFDDLSNEEFLLYSKLHAQIFSPSVSLIHKSILAGEYYLPLISTTIDEIIHCLEDIRDKSTATHRTYFSALEPIDELRMFLNIYKGFSQTVQNRLKYNKAITFFTEDISEKEISKESLNDLVETLEEIDESQPDDTDTYKLLTVERLLFRMNLKLAFIDLSLHCSDSVLYDLVSVSTYLKKHAKTAVYLIAQLLDDKCKYLIYKIFTRVSGKNNANSGIISTNHELLFYKNHKAPIIVDGVELKVKDSEIRYFKHFVELTKQTYDHHTIQDKEVKVREITALELEVFESLNSDEQEGIDFYKIHKLSRAYYIHAEILPNAFKNAENLYGLVKSKKVVYNEERLGDFDKYAHHSLISFLFYNLLRTNKVLLFEAIRSNDHEAVVKHKANLDKIFTIAPHLAEETNIHCYHPYRVYVNAYIEYLDYELKAHRQEFTIEDLNNEVKKITPYFFQYTKNIEWAQDKHQLTLYLPYEQSFIPDDALPKGSTSLKLFLDSSYILPINVDYLRKESEYFYDLFQEKRILLTHELILNTKRGIEESISDRLKRSEELTSNSIHNNQIRNIEVLSLFTAILAFLLVGITTLPKFDDFFVMFLFMYGIAICLTIFVILIDYILKQSFNRNVLKLSGLAFGIFILLLTIKIIFPKEVEVPFNKSFAKDTSAVKEAPPIVVGTDTTQITATPKVSPIAADTSKK